MPFPVSDLALAALDYGATVAGALAGGLLAARRGYDVAGTGTVALVAATGGGLLRDGLFLQVGPPLLVRTWVYIALVLGALAVVVAVGRRLKGVRFDRVVALFDALGLGAFTVVGMGLAEAEGIGAPGVLLVGVVNAVGGGVLRDVLMRREPEMFRPGAWFALASLAGGLLYLLVGRGLGASAAVARWTTIVAVAGLRLVALRGGLRTRPIRGFVATDDGASRD